MKKQRKNTVSREAVEKEMPRPESREKRPGNFDKKPRPSRKPRRDGDDKKRSYSKDKAGGEKKEYFKEFYKENSKKKKEDFKPRKEKNAVDANGKKVRRNKIDAKSIDSRAETENRGAQREFRSRDERRPKRDRHEGEKRPYQKERRLGGKNKEEGRNRKPKWTKEQKLERAIKEGRVAPPEEKELVPEKMPLNKYISRAGICSRREAADLIKAGEVKVNGEVNKEPGYKVVDGDIITYQGKDLEKQEKMVYLLLNKAKDYITTMDDPEGRKTVMDLFTSVEERIFPVGRLDRNTTGLLLLTNDGHLAQKLSHPKFMNKKVYQVKLDKALTQDDFDKIEKGLDLEDGVADIDTLAFTNPEDHREIGIEIHIGKNRIVRRIFEHLGYEVKHLDRVMYAGLTKKNLPRGKWRALTDKELVFLKHYK